MCEEVFMCETLMERLLKDLPLDWHCLGGRGKRLQRALILRRRNQALSPSPTGIPSSGSQSRAGAHWV